MALEITRLFGGFFLAPALQQKWMVVLDYLRCIFLWGWVWVRVGWVCVWGGWG